MTQARGLGLSEALLFLVRLIMHPNLRQEYWIHFSKSEINVRNEILEITLGISSPFEKWFRIRESLIASPILRDLLTQLGQPDDIDRATFDTKKDAKKLHPPHMVLFYLIARMVKDFSLLIASSVITSENQKDFYENAIKHIESLAVLLKDLPSKTPKDIKRLQWDPSSEELNDVLHEKESSLESKEVKITVASTTKEQESRAILKKYSDIAREKINAIKPSKGNVEKLQAHFDLLRQNQEMKLYGNEKFNDKFVNIFLTNKKNILEKINNYIEEFKAIQTFCDEESLKPTLLPAKELERILSDGGKKTDGEELAGINSLQAFLETINQKFILIRDNLIKKESEVLSSMATTNPICKDPDALKKITTELENYTKKLKNLGKTFPILLQSSTNGPGKFTDRNKFFQDRIIKTLQTQFIAANKICQRLNNYLQSTVDDSDAKIVACLMTGLLPDDAKSSCGLVMLKTMVDEFEKLISSIAVPVKEQKAAGESQSSAASDQPSSSAKPLQR